jgi:hypothetical protein
VNREEGRKKEKEEEEKEREELPYSAEVSRRLICHDSIDD